MPTSSILFVVGVIIGFLGILGCLTAVQELSESLVHHVINRKGSELGTYKGGRIAQMVTRSLARNIKVDIVETPDAEHPYEVYVWTWLSGKQCAGWAKDQIEAMRVAHDCIGTVESWKPLDKAKDNRVMTYKVRR